MTHHIDTLYNQARDLPARHALWDELRAAERAEMLTCINHPGRATVAWIDTPEYGYCEDCIDVALLAWRKAQGLVRGGLPR